MEEGRHPFSGGHGNIIEQAFKGNDADVVKASPLPAKSSSDLRVRDVANVLQQAGTTLFEDQRRQNAIAQTGTYTQHSPEF